MEKRETGMSSEQMLYFIIKITSVSSDFTETTVLNRNTIHNTRECVETEAAIP